jgi:hypothetical protein
VSITLAMIRTNVPLCKWREFDASRAHSSFSRKEDTRKIAQLILKQCGHADVIELVAREFNSFPDALRLDFRTLANDQNAASGNVRKGLQRLNERLGGKLAREETHRSINVRVETVDGVSYRRKRVDEAVAGAKRKYGKL